MILTNRMLATTAQIGVAAMMSLLMSPQPLQDRVRAALNRPTAIH